MFCLLESVSCSSPYITSWVLYCPLGSVLPSGAFESCLLGPVLLSGFCFCLLAPVLGPVLDHCIAAKQCTVSQACMSCSWMNTFLQIRQLIAAQTSELYSIQAGILCMVLHQQCALHALDHAVLPAVFRHSLFRFDYECAFTRPQFAA